MQYLQFPAQDEANWHSSVCVVSGVRLYFLLQLDEKDISCKYPTIFQTYTYELGRELLRRCGLELG